MLKQKKKKRNELTNVNYMVIEAKTLNTYECKKLVQVDLTRLEGEGDPQGIAQNI